MGAYLSGLMGKLLVMLVLLLRGRRDAAACS
jgi:hypothetical protein